MCRSKEDVDKFSELYGHLSKEEKDKALSFHYFVIMAISAQSTDTKTKECYNSLMEGVVTPLDFLLPLKDLELSEFIEVLLEIMRKASMSGSKILPLIECPVVSIIFFDGDIRNMNPDDLRGFEQIGYKKTAIISNVMASLNNGNGFCSVGGDTHVIRVLGLLLKKFRITNDPKEFLNNEMKKEYILHNIGKDVGFFTNEVLAQYGQLLAIIKSLEQAELNVLFGIKARMVDKNATYKYIFDKWKTK